VPVVGQTIPLALKLWDGVSDKYVKATVRDNAGVEITGSPVLLSHVGEGNYKVDTLLMPDVDFVTTSYIVYDDSLLSTESIDYTHGTDTFLQEVPNSVIVDKLDEIIATLNALQGQSTEANLKGYIIGDEVLTGIIQEAEEIKGLISGDSLQGTVSEDSLAIQGNIEDDEEIISGGLDE